MIFFRKVHESIFQKIKKNKKDVHSIYNNNNLENFRKNKNGIKKVVK